MDYQLVGKSALWSAVGGAIFCSIMFGLIYQVNFATFLATLGLVPMGSAIVGALICLTLLAAKEEHE